MPNWCDNTIRITGTQEKIDQIFHIIKDAESNSGYLFASLCPSYKTKEELGWEESTKENAEQVGDDKYQWYHDNQACWGTKWDVPMREVYSWAVGDADFKALDIMFSTAWSPCIGFCQKLMETYDVGVSNKYYEPGVDFIGLWQDGSYVLEMHITDLYKNARKKDPSALETLTKLGYSDLTFFKEETLGCDGEDDCNCFGCHYDQEIMFDPHMEFLRLKDAVDTAQAERDYQVSEMQTRINELGVFLKTKSQLVSKLDEEIEQIRKQITDLAKSLGLEGEQ